MVTMLRFSTIYCDDDSSLQTRLTFATANGKLNQMKFNQHNMLNDEQFCMGSRLEILEYTFFYKNSRLSN